MTRSISALIFSLTAALCLSKPAFGFGGEDIYNGSPWHHEDITIFALSGDDEYYPNSAKFSAGAAESIAWHADNIDSYLYNPLFWAKGGADRDRTKAALVGFSDLAKLHFDDTFTNTGIQANWERYAAGTLIGLYWASLQGSNGDVAAAQSILGVSFHAVQDFYSHSSWVTDPGRRCHTYFQTSKDYRDNAPLYTGAYEKPESGAQIHHGAYSFSCSVWGREGLDSLLGTVCGAYSPVQNAGMCQSYRSCKGSQDVEMQFRNPLPLPNSATVYLHPKGIALDNTLLAKVQAKHRNLVDENGSFLKGRDGMHFKPDRCPAIIRSSNIRACSDDTQQVFAGVKDLAIRATIEWAEYLEGAMEKMGPKQADFWNRVKNQPTTEDQRAAQFEDFTKLPYQFLAAGPYPLGNPSVLDREAAYTANGWYLRLRIKTADSLFAGTNSDIYADVQMGETVQSVKLDYLPTNDPEGHTTNRILVYNDFEEDDDDVYTIGPFPERPSAIRLRNQDKGAGDVFAAIYNDLVNGIDHTLTDLRQIVIGFIGGNADYVGQKVKAYTVPELKALGNSATRKLEIRGGNEGDHDVIYTITKRPELVSADLRRKGYIGLRISLRSLHTIHESKVDRGTNSDEPFVLWQVSPLSGERNEQNFAYVSAPFEDMDDDEREDFPNRGSLVKDMVLPPQGMVVVAAKIFESDSENDFDRRTLLTEFVTGLDEATQRPKGEFLDALGASLAEDWTPQFIEAFAFQRGNYPVAGEVLQRTRLSEIGGGEASEYLTLDWSKQKQLLQSGAEPVLMLESDDPKANQLLEGEWFSTDYYCGERQSTQKVELRLSGNHGHIVHAYKADAPGDECVKTGEMTFRGRYLNGELTGKRRTVPPVYNRPKWQLFPDHPLDIEPNYLDPSIHPRLSLEGNWEIVWAGTDQPPVKATLHKGGGRSCVKGDGGCWYQFTRDEASPWSLEYHPSPAGAHMAQSVTVSSGGQIAVDWGYSHLGYWGGESELTAGSDDSITGGWAYGDDEQGGETWVRRRAVVKSVQVRNGDEVLSASVGTPLTIDTKYVPHDYTMRGNRSQITIDLYGDHMWGIQYAFIPWSTDLEIARMDYICAPGAAYAAHSWWSVCEGSGGTVGVRITMNVWDQAETKLHKLMFNGEEIPFKLNVIGEPQRYPKWEDLKMRLTTCGLFEEFDRDRKEHPIRLVRADPDKH